MKDKINEYVDGRIKKEELEFFLSEEDRKYLNDLIKMKEGLKLLNVQAPDFVEIIEEKTKRRVLFKYSFALASIFIIIVVGFISKPLILKKLQVGYNNETITTKTLISKEDQYSIAMLKEIAIKLEIDKSEENTLIEELKKVANLLNYDEKNHTYSFEVKGSNLEAFTKTIEDFKNASILENTLKENIDENLIYNVSLTIVYK
ncbi:MAG: hypothetical protein K6343_01210 [Caldisericaceae bacterium]